MRLVPKSKAPIFSSDNQLFPSFALKREALMSVIHHNINAAFQTNDSSIFLRSFNLQAPLQPSELYTSRASSTSSSLLNLTLSRGQFFLLPLLLLFPEFPANALEFVNVPGVLDKL
jgi:hypothetical protein